MGITLRTLATVCLAAALGSAAEVPRPAPDFAIDMAKGKKIQLSEYKGKVRALVFILTTCPHCQKTVGHLSALQKEFGPRGFQALASATEAQSEMHVADFVKRFKPSFPVGFNDYKVALGFLTQPEMVRLYMPQLVFIDRKGIIRAQYGGDDKFFAEDQEKHLRDQIEALLNEAAPAVKKHAAPKPK